MARNHARILTSIWDNDDFLNLEPYAQRVYLLLVSQPDLTPCGALPYLPGRWSRLSKSTTEREIEVAVEELEVARFVVVDRDTQELVIRTFVVHDGGLGNPKMRGAVKSALKALHSRRLRAEVAAVLPDDHRAEIVDGLSIEWQSNDDPEPGTSAIGSNVEVGGRRQGSVSSASTDLTDAEEHDLTLVAAEPPPVDPVVAVFDAWQESTGHRKAVLDKPRRKAIERALKHYPPDECIAAVRGVMLFPHNRGETTGIRYDDVALVLRDSEHVERFRDAWVNQLDVAPFSPDPEPETTSERGRLADEIDPCPLGLCDGNGRLVGEDEHGRAIDRGRCAHLDQHVEAVTA